MYQAEMYKSDSPDFGGIDPAELVPEKIGQVELNLVALKQGSQAASEQDKERLAKLRQTALGLLARREHSHCELEYKLHSRGFFAEEIAPVLEVLAHQGALSNVRFAQQYVHSRVQRGFGPVRIRAELRERGLDNQEIDLALLEEGADWEKQAQVVRIKRFSERFPKDFKELARQQRFLQQRGYSQDQIKSALAETE